MSNPADTEYSTLFLNATFDSDVFQTYSTRYQEEFIIIGLLWSLYGVLATLSTISCYALITQRRGRIHQTTAFLCSTILVLFASTTIYVVVCMLYYHTNLMFDLRVSLPSGGDTIWVVEEPFIIWNLMGSPGNSALEQKIYLQACASAGTLTVNVTVGDAIVCWRACVIWRKNKLVRTVCAVLLVATFILGVIDAYQSCLSMSSYGVDTIDPGIPGTLFEGISFGVASCVLSLSTNTFATLLVACKAWQSRRRIKGYLVTKLGGSLMEKLLSLLIESGAIYCAIWALVVAFQFGDYLSSNYPFSYGISIMEYKFVTSFRVFMTGVLVPAIAIYPTIIIVLIAFNRSHVERGLTDYPESVPTPHVAITVDTVTTTLQDSQGNRRSKVLDIDQQESGCGDTWSLEDARGLTSDQLKLGEDLVDPN